MQSIRFKVLLVRGRKPQEYPTFKVAKALNAIRTHTALDMSYAKVLRKKASSLYSLPPLIRGRKSN
jgi:hypothetical protein